jgi:hypothetical protein
MFLSRRVVMNKFFVLLLVFFSGYLYADKIAIWNLVPQAGVTDKEAATISSILTGEIERISGKSVISESEMRAVVDGESMRIACGAEDNVCIAEIGAALGAPFSVSGTLSKMGDYWIITMQLVDVRKVQVKSRVSKRFKGEANTLVEAITPIVCELFDDKECLDDALVKTGKRDRTPRSGDPVSWKKVTGWTFTTVGALSIETGFAGYALMNQAKKDYEYDGQNEQKYKDMRAVSLAGFIAGSVFVAGGVTLLILDAVGKKRKNENMSFYLIPHTEGFVAGFQGSW